MSLGPEVAAPAEGTEGARGRATPNKHATSSPQHLPLGRALAVGAAVALPWLLPLLSHVLLARFRGLNPSGFITYDMAYYMANAREAFDAMGHGAFTPWYANPFTFDAEATPRIYFQPLIFLLGLTGWLSGLAPGVVFAVANVAGILICAVVAIRLLETVLGDESGAPRWFTLVSFFWGGGLLCLIGLTSSLVRYGDGRGMLALDPEEGWWFLNFGRNLVFATEAFYHAAFFGAILALLRKRYAAALALCALLSISHPFTGIQLILILTAWTLVERFLFRRTDAPRWFPAGCAILGALHVAYYLVFLPADPAHRQLMEQWRMPWLLEASSFIPAYAIVGALALWRMRSPERAGAVLASPQARLLVVWFVVSFILANHELAVDPVQPLHFTRGYIWTPLFLLGAPVLVKLYAWLLQSSRRRGRAVALAALFFMTLDNTLWAADRSLGGALTAPHRQPGGAPPRIFGFAPTDAQWDVLQWLNRPEHRGFVVVADDWQVSYLTTVYTPLRSWKSHESNTPWTKTRAEELRRFFSEGVAPDAWRALPLLIIYAEPGVAAREFLLSGRPVHLAYRNAGFVVYRSPAIE